MTTNLALPRRPAVADRRYSLTRSALVAVLVVVYGGVLWLWFRPDFIQNWRESDTQTIARHLTEPGASLFYPRIDWGGTGPGYVETEFQLYTWIVSRIMKVSGPAEWPGQLVSLASVLLTAGVIYWHLRRRYGEAPAAFGVLALLSSRIVVQTGTTVQPEALCLLLFSAAWFAFQDYTESQRPYHLAVFGVLGAAAMLVKPTAAQIGIASGLLVLFHSPRLLRRKALWFTWLLMVGALALHLLHARAIYLEYGNTFGVLSGGDSKIPRLEHLLVPQLVIKAAVNSTMWGVGLVGLGAALAAIALRRPDAAAVAALLIANAVWTLLALRYTSRAGGNHYHVLGAVLAAQAVAIAVATLSQWRFRTYAKVAIACALAVTLHKSLSLRAWNRHNVFDEPAVAVADVLKQHARPDDLIVVRSVADRYDTYWKTIANFEDPRVFYLTRTRGWPIGKEIADPAPLEQARADGARFYVEPESRPLMPAVDAWLSTQATLLGTTTYGGKVYALTPTARRP